MRLLSIILVFSVAHLMYGANEITGKVVSVIDGNTIEIKDDQNETLRLVLDGIDSPELEQRFGKEAKAYLEKLVLNKKVKANIKGKDRHGNYIAVILAGDDDPRVKLLREGLAWTAEKNAPEELEPYRIFAQQKGKGLWKEKDPTPPWVFRRQQTMTQPKSS